MHDILTNVRIIKYDSGRNIVSSELLHEKIERSEFLKELFSEKWTTPSDEPICRLCYNDVVITIRNQEVFDRYSFPMNSLIILASVVSDKELITGYRLTRRKYARKGIRFYPGWYVDVDLVAKLRRVGVPINNQALYDVR